MAEPKIRGQVRKYIKAAVRMGATSNTLMSPRYKSPNLNTKDKLQLAAIIRGKSPWAKAARKELFS